MSKMNDTAKEIAEEIREGMKQLNIKGCGCFINVSQLAKVLGKDRGTIRAMFADLPRYGPQREYKVSEVAKNIADSRVYVRYGA